VAVKAVEVWDALTLKLLSTMQSPTATIKYMHGIVYSPDKRSLAGCSSSAIIIWDTQTGGVVREIKRRDTQGGLELAWSLDGETIGTISSGMFTTTAVKSYNLTLYTVTSGVIVFSGELQAGNKPYLWAHGKHFQIATMTGDNKGNTIDLIEAGVTLNKIKSFPLKFHSTFGPFSPSTHQISILTPESLGHNPGLLILDIHTSRILLQREGFYQHLTFSHDGSLFAAFTRDHLFLWKFSSSGYIQWRKVEQSPLKVQFSPTLSSIFGYGGPLLYILPLDDSPTVPATEPAMVVHSQPLDAFSPHGTFIITTHYQQSTITITNLNSLRPFQFIDTDLIISEIVLTGNVLLVKSSDAIVGWLLSEEGVVDGILGNSRADQNDSLWKILPQDKLLPQQQSGDRLEFAVKDEIAAITYNGIAVHAYHTRTGEVIGSSDVSDYSFQTWYRFNHPLKQNDCSLYHHKCNELVKSNWPVSQSTLQEGWVKDPVGKYRLWLHAHWRSAGNEVDWLNKVTTLRIRDSSELVVIKL
jgi:WD40 repeat protein